VSRPRTIRIAPGTLHRELQGEGVLLQLDTGEYFGLDEIGERIWTLIAAHGNLAEVQARMLDEYDVDSETLSRDLHGLVDALVSHRLVEVDA
jgi:hypothetical protein